MSDVNKAGYSSQYGRPHGLMDRHVCLTARVSLRSGIVARPRTWSYFRELAKLQARALLHPRETRRWLAMLNDEGALNELASRNPHLVRKIYRPYLSLKYRCQDRLRALAAHYALMSRKGLMPVILSAASQPVMLTRFSGKSGAPYEISLRATSAFDREGELVLRLTQAGELVYSIAFSMVNEYGYCDPAVFVGCIQGSKGLDAMQRIRDAGRELHGMRAKNLMVRLVRQVGYDLGCRHMILVGNRNRVAHRYRKAVTYADYDLLWREFGAQARDDGNFEMACEDLPCSLTMTTVPSSKRSEVRRRHALLRSIAADVRSHLGIECAEAADMRGRSAATADWVIRIQPPHEAAGPLPHAGGPLLGGGSADCCSSASG